MGDRSPDEMFIKKGLALPKPRLIAGGNPSKPLELHTQITQALGYK
jgi:hypothetical protein